ncbi:unnamed protein product [Symbiodinium sp. CCMP2592]|nr:unnamed protein product [Symbiodinium sp. CCMP2592]CAE7541034.1 unnamed protein product [Symbiodinium sp. CCMP2592]
MYVNAAQEALLEWMAGIGEQDNVDKGSYKKQQAECLDRHVSACYQPKAVWPQTVITSAWERHPHVDPHKASHELPVWAEARAKELTEAYDHDHDHSDVPVNMTGTRPNRVLQELNQQVRSRSPVVKPRCTGNPWTQQTAEDRTMLKTSDDVLKGLRDWCDQMSPITRAQKADLTIAFDPTPPVRSEAQLHQRVSAMGIDVFAKGSNPTAPPFGIQGGQIGQYSVTVSLSLDPLVRFTIQLQCAKGNVVVKGKRTVFEVDIVLMLLRFLGIPKSIAVKVPEAKSRDKALDKPSLISLCAAQSSEPKAPADIWADLRRTA